MSLFPHVTLKTRGGDEEWRRRKRKSDDKEVRRQDRSSPSWGRCGTSPGRPPPKPDWRPRRWWPSAAGLHPCAPRSSTQTCPRRAPWHPGISGPPVASHPTPGSSPWRSSWGDTPPKTRSNIRSVFAEEISERTAWSQPSIFYQYISAAYIFTEESCSADSTKEGYFRLRRQETKRIMEEAGEGRRSLTHLLALAFFCREKM